MFAPFCTYNCTTEYIFYIMQSDEVCFLDSGVGGISILVKCRELIKTTKFLYIADNAFAPYGNYGKRKICKILERLIKNIHAQRGIKIFVLACNTATAVAIRYLRAKFPTLIFIGTEPPIKPAFDGTKTLILCTKATYKYSLLLHKYKAPYIIFAPQNRLAKLIDKNIDNLWNIFGYLHIHLKKFKAQNIQNIVLGCTHYYFIIPQLKAIFPQATIYDSALGVAKQLYKFCNINSGDSSIEFMTTKKDNNFQNKLISTYQKYTH